ncbi:MAG: Trk K+ transport system NAD-binding subunit [Halieaceae bacterium]|jgi:Trk K+ transport system NAD-binding subunit
MNNPGRGSNWRSFAAIFIVICGMTGLLAGVSVSEKPDIETANLLTMAYYTMSLFVVGGVDLGIPTGGPGWGRGLLWFAYFGAPVLAAWTLLSTLLNVISPQRWQLRRARNHIIVVGANELSLSYLRVLRRHNKKVPVVLVCREIDETTRDEFVHSYNAMVVVGDVTHEYFLSKLRPQHALKIMLLGQDSLRAYEAASILTSMVPGIGERIVLHCVNLRFMRAMASTRVAKECQTFNTYHLAAAGLVHNHLLTHFAKTEPKDAIILAGFGRFGQTVLEELQKCALDELSTVVILDTDAKRRVRVADEQMEFLGDYRRELFEGDISNPEVWEQIRNYVTLNKSDTVVVLGTGRESENLRTALWIRREFPKARIITRSTKGSRFAREVGREHDLTSVSIAELVEDNIPPDWILEEG